MGAHADARRRLLAAHGRTMTLRRTATPPVAAVSLIGFPHGFQPGAITGGVQQGDMLIEISADELRAAPGFTLPPRNPDRVAVDARTYTVLDARPLYDGPELIGFALWARGA